MSHSQSPALIEARALCAEIGLSLPVRLTRLVEGPVDKRTGKKKMIPVFYGGPVFRAVREISKLFHPDRHVNSPPDVAAAAEERLKRINQAKLRLLKIGEDGLWFIYPETLAGLTREQVHQMMQQKLADIKAKNPKDRIEIFTKYPDRCSRTGKLVCPKCLEAKSSTLWNLKKHLSDVHKVNARFEQSGHQRRSMERIRTQVAGGRFMASGYYEASKILRRQAATFNKAQ